MPRYFFHVHNGVDQRDNQGVEFAGPDEARAQAIVACGEALRDLEGAFWDGGQEWRMTVTDWRGKTLCVITVAGSRQPLA